MKILLAHNKHRTGSTSGDDRVFENERKLLEQKGNKLIIYERCNDEIDKLRIWEKGLLGLSAGWSKKSYYEIKSLLKRQKPDLVHLHNIFPLISPSAYYCCKQMRVPVVQTLHDYRFLCPMAFFLRNSQICEDCINGGLWKAIIHRCVSDSYLQSMASAGVVWIYNFLRTWDKLVDCLVTPTEFTRKKIIQAGFPKAKVFVKPHFLPDPPKPNLEHGNYVVFLGRVGKEKGLKVLINAWSNIEGIPLKIIGDGPQRSEYERLTTDLRIENLEFLGRRDYSLCMQMLRNSRMLIMPSVCYETFGLPIIEAYAGAKPVIASRLGAMAELVIDDKTGLLFEPGNPGSLASKVEWLWENEDACIEMGRNAFAEFEKKYTAERNYEILMGIYDKATAGALRKS